MNRRPIVALLALLVLLVVAAPASAATETRGSNLQAAVDPNAYNDCTYLQSVISGPVVNPWGATSCTYVQGYVFGNTSDPRTGFVTGNGVIGQVTVKSGANPAPLRFVILRQLTNAQNGAVSGEPKCCFFVSESAPVQPAPNSVQTFPVNLPVENNVQPNVITQDMLGFSAPTGGSLPLAFLPGFTDLAFAPNAVTASSFHPAVNAAQHGVGTGGAFASNHFSGLEVLMQYTFIPSGRGQPIPANILSIGGPSVLRPIGRDLDVLLNCLQTTCDGTLSLLSRNPVAASRASIAKKKIRSLGKRKFSIKQGKGRKVKLRLNSLGRRLTTRQGTRVTIVVELSGIGTVKKNRTLRRR